MRRRSRSTCTSSALRVGTPVGQARSASISRVTTAPKRSSEHRGQRLLDGRERHPPVVMMQQAVLVEQRPHRVLSGAEQEGGTPRVDLPLGRARGHPVFEAVGWERELAVDVGLRDDEQARHPLLPELCQPLGVGRPPNHFDVHGPDGTSGLLRPCYPVVTAPQQSVAGRVQHRRSQPATRMLAQAVDRTAHADRRDDRVRRSRTGALTLATPASRSPTLSAQPRRRTAASSRAGIPNVAASSAHASNTLPPEPSSSGSTAPSGTVSRRPLGRSCAATQTRWSPFAHDTAARSRRSLPLSWASIGCAIVARPRSAAAPHAASAGAEHESPCTVACEGAVALECDREPVNAVGRGRPVCTHEVGERARALARDRVEDVHCPVEHLDPACYTDHEAILASHIVRQETNDMASTLSEKIWERHVVRSAAGEPDLLYIDLHLVHEVTSPQAFDGLRLAGRARAPPRPHGRDDGPQRPDRGTRPAARGPDLGQADGGARAELRGVRHPALRHARPRPGHRARDRSRARPHAAGHDDRVRRQPHVDARRVRRARVRHRHERGRARARDADAAADASRARWRSRSTASCRRVSPRRTSCSRSSPASAPAAASAR